MTQVPASRQGTQQLVGPQLGFGAGVLGPQVRFGMVLVDKFALGPADLFVDTNASAAPVRAKTIPLGADSEFPIL